MTMDAQTPFTFTPDTDITIIVEFPAERGLKQVGLSPEDLAKKSNAAIQTAMQSIYRMSRQTVATLKAIPLVERPSQAEVEFGIKSDAEAGAVLAKAGMEASINVKLVWEKHDDA